MIIAGLTAMVANANGPEGIAGQCQTWRKHLLERAGMAPRCIGAARAGPLALRTHCHTESVLDGQRLPSDIDCCTAASGACSMATVKFARSAVEPQATPPAVAFPSVSRHLWQQSVGFCRPAFLSLPPKRAMSGSPALPRSAVCIQSVGGRLLFS